MSVVRDTLYEWSISYIFLFKKKLVLAQFHCELEIEKKIRNLCWNFATLFLKFYFISPFVWAWCVPRGTRRRSGRRRPWTPSLRSSRKLRHESVIFNFSHADPYHFHWFFSQQIYSFQARVFTFFLQVFCNKPHTAITSGALFFFLVSAVKNHLVILKWSP